MTQAFYRKWRPQTWDDVVGQDQVIQTLRNAVRGGRTGHAYLFAGPRGTGKTSTARLLAKALNCTQEDLSARPCNACEHCTAIQEGRFLDLIEIDAASNTSVEDVRDLRDKINFSPNHGRYKVYIIDEVHMLSTAAFNALLKTLEEPPAHAVFILATTEVHKIPATVLSRCQRHEFRRLPPATMVPYLLSMIESEGLKVDMEVLPVIARQATGSLRDAISLLDQLSSTGESVTLRQARDVLGIAANDAVIDLVRAIEMNQPSEGLSLIQRALDGGTDPRQFSRQVVDYLHSLLLVKMGSPDLAAASVEDLAQAEALAEVLPLDFLLAVLRVFQDASQERHSTRIPSLPLEIAFLESIQILHNRQQETTGRVPASTPGVGAAETGLAIPAVTPAAAKGKVSTRVDEKPGTATTAASGFKVEAASMEKRIETVPSPGPAAGSDPVQGPQGDPFNLIQREWKRFLGEIRKRDPILQGLINSCRPLGFDDQALILGFEADILREKMLKPENMALAQEALEAVLGFDAGIRCILSDQWAGLESPAAPAPTHSSVQAEAAEPVRAQASSPSGSAYGEGGIVAAAVEQYGAKIVEVEDIPDAELGPDD